MKLFNKKYVLILFIIGTTFNLISQTTVKIGSYASWNFGNEVPMEFAVYSDTNIADTLTIQFGLENNTTDSLYFIEKTRIVSDFVALPLPYTGYYASFADTFSFYHPTYMHEARIGNSRFKVNKTGLLTHASFEFRGFTSEPFTTNHHSNGFNYDSLTDNWVYGGYYGGGGTSAYYINEELDPKLLEADFIGVEVDFIRIMPNQYPFGISYGDTNIIGKNLMLASTQMDDYESYAVFATPLNNVYYNVSTLISTDSFDSFGFTRSTMVDNLKIYPVYNKVICSLDSIEINSVMVNAEGLYMDTLFTTLGTDSVFAINLRHTNTIYNTDTLEYTICLEDTLFLDGGNYLVDDGFHQVNLSSQGGCDSIVYINLETRDEPISSVISNVNNILSVDVPNGLYTYQWLNLTTGNILTGEVSYSFEPSENGEYAVIITNGVCSEISNSIGTSIGLGEVKIDFRISPNPFSDMISVLFDANQSKIEVEITDIQSRVVFENTYTETNHIQISGKNLNNGIYYLRIKNGLTEVSKPIIRLK